MGKTVVLVLGALLFATAIARAETPEERQACTNDAFSVCGDAIPDRDRVFACLIRSKDRISALCRSALAPYLAPDPQPAPRKSAAGTKVKKPKAKKSASARRGPVDLNPGNR
jgi:hypothetical protein